MPALPNTRNAVNDIIQAGKLVRVTAKDSDGKRFSFFAAPGTDSLLLGQPVRVFSERSKDNHKVLDVAGGKTAERTRIIQSSLIVSEIPYGMSKTFGEWVPVSKS